MTGSPKQAGSGMAGRRAFSLVELLVVPGVIVILVALLLPAIQTARRSGWSSQCQNNLKNLCLAFKKTHANPQGRVRAGDESLERFLGVGPKVALSN
jgi:Tfp pilus assembly protein FimT